jgi:hypothetical protein
MLAAYKNKQNALHTGNENQHRALCCCCYLPTFDYLKQEGLIKMRRRRTGGVYFALANRRVHASSCFMKRHLHLRARFLCPDSGAHNNGQFTLSRAVSAAVNLHFYVCAPVRTAAKHNPPLILFFYIENSLLD